MHSIKNIAVISDIHAGCQFGLCPPEIALDGGGVYHASELQNIVFGWWGEYWQWVQDAVGGEPFAVVFNGDALDGRHHHATTQISQNLSDQARIAAAMLAPVVDLCEGRYYHIRGTEAHVGQTGEDEERLAQSIGAIPDKYGHHARWEIWIRCGPRLCHILHHIGTTGSVAYESTAPMKELSEAFTHSARWSTEPPAVVVRSHRHQNIEIRVPCDWGNGIVFTTAGWQLKTPLVHRIPGARLTTPQIGGSLIRYNERDDEIYTRHMVWKIPQPDIEVV